MCVYVCECDTKLNIHSVLHEHSDTNTVCVAVCCSGHVVGGHFMYVNTVTLTLCVAVDMWSVDTLCM